VIIIAHNNIIVGLELNDSVQAHCSYTYKSLSLERKM